MSTPETSLAVRERSEARDDAPRKRSRRIQLVLTGVCLVAGCNAFDSSTPTLPDRYAYDQRDNCVADWGDDNCERTPAPATSGSSSHGAYWYGPRFNSSVTTPSGRIYTGEPQSRVANTPGSRSLQSTHPSSYAGTHAGSSSRGSSSHGSSSSSSSSHSSGSTTRGGFGHSAGAHSSGG